jgi:hypothetical protein
MSLFLRIVQVSEIDEILDYENRKLREQVNDEVERQMQSWNARWRRESLEHYLPIGWSFIARDSDLPSDFSKEGLLVGYFMAQPMLFVDGQTQSLWVEHLQYSTLQARDELCDLAYRLAREKHFQRVYFPNTPALAPTLKSMKSEEWNSAVVMLKTTKVSV